MIFDSLGGELEEKIDSYRKEASFIEDEHLSDAFVTVPSMRSILRQHTKEQTPSPQLISSGSETFLCRYVDIYDSHGLSDEYFDFT